MIDHELTDTPVCPYCGYKVPVGDLWEYEGEYAYCDACDRDYGCTAFVQVSYSTSKLEEVKDE